MIHLGINAGLNLEWAITTWGFIEAPVDGDIARLVSPFGHPYLIGDPAKLAGILGRARLADDAMRATLMNIAARSFVPYGSGKLPSLENMINSYRFRAAKAINDPLLSGAWNAEAAALETRQGEIQHQLEITLMANDDAPLSDEVYDRRITAAD